MRIFRMKRFILLSIVALALAVAEIAQASTIQLGIRSGATATPDFGMQSAPALCGATGPFTPRVACVDTNTAVITDGSALDTNGLASAITWSGTIGPWYLEVTGTGYDYLGLGRMDLSFSVTASGTPTDFLEIYFSQPGNPRALGPSLFRMDLDGTANLGTVEYNAGFCNANMVDFMRATSLAGSGLVGPGSFDRSWLGNPGQNIANGAPYYSLTQKVEIRASGADAQYSGLAELQPVPEPTSLLLLGTGLGVIGLAAWRRKK